MLLTIYFFLLFFGKDLAIDLILNSFSDDKSISWMFLKMMKLLGTINSFSKIPPTLKPPLGLTYVLSSHQHFVEANPNTVYYFGNLMVVLL